MIVCVYVRARVTIFKLIVWHYKSRIDIDQLMSVHKFPALTKKHMILYWFVLFKEFCLKFLHKK